MERTRMSADEPPPPFGAPPPQSCDREWGIPRPIILVLLFLMALGLRLFYLWEIYDQPAFSLLLGDGQSYDAWAREIAGGNWLGNKVFYQAPLYPYFLGLIYALFGPSHLLARLIQAILGSAACLFLAAAGRSFFGRGTGLLAGALLAVYPAAIFADGLIQKSSLDIFFMTLLLLILGRAATKSSPRLWFASGLVLGCLALTRENALVLIMAAAAWLAAGGGRSPRRVAAGLGLFAAGLGLILMPVAGRNLAVGGEFHLTTSQFGPNFYIGNNAAADGTYRPLVPGHGAAVAESGDAADLAEKAEGRRLSPGEVSAYWTGEALRFIREHPGRWLSLMIRKSLLVWNRIEICDTDDQYSYGDWSLLLGFLNRGLHFGLIVPLAAMGLVLTWPSRSRLWVLYLILGGYAASVALFYVFARYRLPLVPPLLLFAGAGVMCLFEGVRRVPRRRLAAAAAVAAAVIANWPLMPNLPVISRATMQNNIGTGLMAGPRNREEALGHFAEAIRIDPLYAEPHKNMGLTLRAMGRIPEAIEHFRRAAELRPDSAEIQVWTGRCYFELGRLNEALSSFRGALELDPSSAEAHYGLGVTLERLQRREEASAHLAEAARLDPRFALRL